MRMQRDFYHNYYEHKELSQYVREAKNTTFPILSTSAIVSLFPIGEDGDINELSILKNQ